MVDTQLELIDAAFVGTVKPARWPATCDVSIEANHVRGEPIPHGQAVAGEFVPFSEGDPWGPLWDTTWFHVTGTVPQEWAGRDVALVVHLGYGGGSGFGAEGLVWVDGRPVSAIDPNHREVVIGSPASGGESFDLHIEAAANPPAPPTDPGPILLAEPDGEPFLELRRCHLAIVDRDVEALVRDWQLVRELVDHTGEQRRADCVAALDAAVARVRRGHRHVPAPHSWHPIGASPGAAQGTVTALG